MAIMVIAHLLWFYEVSTVLWSSRIVLTEHLAIENGNPMVIQEGFIIHLVSSSVYFDY